MTGSSSIQQDVSNFLAMYVLMGGAYAFNQHGHLIIKATEKPIKLNKPNGDPAPVVLYSPTGADPNVIVINPFVDGLSNSEVSRWFYEGRTLFLSVTIYAIMQNVIKTALHCKNNKMEDLDLTSAEISIIQPYLTGTYEVDAKMEKELYTVYNELKARNFFNIYFSRKNNSCTVNATLFDEEQLSTISGKIRKKTLPILSKLFLDILGVSNLTDMVTSAELQGCAKFDAYTKMYVEVLKGLKRYWGFQDLDFDFTKFFSHVDNFRTYYNTAKMVISIPNTSTTATPPWTAGQQQGVPMGSTPMVNNTAIPMGAPGSYTSGYAVPMSTPCVTPMNAQPVTPYVPLTAAQPMGSMPMVGNTMPMGQMMQTPQMFPNPSTHMAMPMNTGVVSNMAMPMFPGMNTTPQVEPTSSNMAPWMRK